MQQLFTSLEIIQLSQKKKNLPSPTFQDAQVLNQPIADPCPLPVLAKTLRMLGTDQGHLEELCWDENNTSTSRLLQKVCVERVVCLEASHRMLNINCKLENISNDDQLLICAFLEKYTL